ncbi:MAG TPA: electron transport complex subunit E [Steroidobacteraceae bacterium]|nr:electron transport complex subunit E [Steroidobacteraceae bacterium]
MDAAATFRNGLGSQNPGLVQLLGLCPLLAVSTTLSNALGLGIATLAVLLVSSLAASLFGRWLLPEVRIGVFVVTIAAAVTAVELVTAAWLPELHQSLGIFLPLIVTNCLVLARAESFASRRGIVEAAVDALGMGVGFLLVLVALGSVREILGHGSLGGDLELLFGEHARGVGLRLFPAHSGWLFALLPPGAFILLGLMVAAHNWRIARRAEGREEPDVGPAEQVGS